MGLSTGIGIGIQFSRGGGQSWESYLPSNLAVKQPGATTAEVTWDDGASAPDGYRLYYSDDNITFSEYTTIAHGVEYCNVTGLTAGVVYYFRLVAYKGSGESDPIIANTVAWWTAEGVAPAEILAVYFPVGAASKAESLKNIVNPGTNDMVEAGTVSWNKVVGWYGFSDSNYLDGLSNKSHTYSIVVLADYIGTTGLRRIVFAEAAGPTGMLLIGNYDNNPATAVRYRQGTYSGTAALNKERLLFGASQTTCFINGVSSGAITPTGGEVIDNLRVGNLSTTPAADNSFLGRVQAIAVYDHSLTDDQMIAIHNKMKDIGYFRDFSAMTQYASNPIITKGAEAWRLDGASIPYVQPDNLADDGYYYAFVPVSAGSWVWDDLALFRSADLLIWEPYGTNPVISTVGGTWENEFMSHPCPIKIGSTYYLYYSSSDTFNKSRLGRASSSDLRTWTKDGSNPLYEDPVSNCHSAWIAKFGATYYLYYRRGNSRNEVIHYATSPDAINFTYGGTCFTTTAADINYNTFALDPFVWLRKDGVYEMVYVNCDSVLPGIQKLTYAISLDGITFHKEYKWLIEGTLNAADWNCGILGVPILFKISNKQTYLYYCGAKDIVAPFSENSGGLAIIPN